MINGLHHAINERTINTSIDDEESKKKNKNFWAFFNIFLFFSLFYFAVIHFVRRWSIKMERKKIRQFQRPYANQVNWMQSKGSIHFVYVCRWKANNGEFSFFIRSIATLPLPKKHVRIRSGLKWIDEWKKSFWQTNSVETHTEGEKRYDLIIASKLIEAKVMCV